VGNYYYLISSLPELILDSGKRVITFKEFIEFCFEQLNEKEFNKLKKIFIFNDIKNSVFHKEKNFKYLVPSFYSEEEFKENLKDTDTFFPFMAEYFYHNKSEKRIYPKMLKIDEIIMLFYQYIDNFPNDLLKKYFMFELDLCNALTALSLRANQITDPDKIIVYTDESKAFIKSTAIDFGLSQHLEYLNKLLDAYKTGDLIKIEKTVENIKWQWLEENAEELEFSFNFICSYTIKLLSVERWHNLTDKRGEEVLNNIMGNISNSVNFENF